MKAIEGPLLLLVLDGVGELATTIGNAVALAPTPVWDRLRATCRFTTLRAHGKAVGLPSDADMGNSEVGHNALGAGQVYDQGAKLVEDAIASGRLWSTPLWGQLLERVKGRNSALHFVGLLSDGNVHSHIDHLLAMLERARQEGVQRVRIHALLDGRDVPGTSAHLYLERLEQALRALRAAGMDAAIASGGGRMHLTMDRYEADWSMVARGWAHHVHGQGRVFADAATALATLRAEQPGILDQDLPGFVIGDNSGPIGTIGDSDSVVLTNFRGDRAIEISRAFEEGDSFTAFDRGRRPDVLYAGMMQYDGDTHVPANFLVGPPNIRHTLTDVLVEAKISQFAISETQKFGHITYFWNGNRSGISDPQREIFREIPSDLVSFDQRPWMKAAEITDALIAELAAGKIRFLRANYANGDMVGHTGDLNAAIAAMACLDLQLGRLMRAVDKAGGVALITADHGNCDQMFEFGKDGQPLLDEDGRPKPKTSHTLSPVPFVLYDPKRQVKAELVQDANLGIASVTGTTLELLGLTRPNIWQPSLLRPV